MSSTPKPSPGQPGGPQPPKEDAESTSTNTRPTRPPIRRQTMEVQVAWLETKLEPTISTISPIEDVPTPPAADVIPEPAPISRRGPPRLPGAHRTMPAMPVVRQPTKPPPPPRRMTQEVEMSWVEIVDEDLTEDDLPNLYDEELDGKPEVTRVEDAPVSTERLEAERQAVRSLGLEGPAIDDALLAKQAEEEARLAKERAAAEEEALLEKMREDALATRKHEQDTRDREMRQKRKAERERERLEQEAKAAQAAQAAQAKKAEEARVATLPKAAPRNQVLDLSGIDAEIDSALDAFIGENLSYPPPPPPDEPDGNA